MSATTTTTPISTPDPTKKRKVAPVQDDFEYETQVEVEPEVPSLSRTTRRPLAVVASPTKKLAVTAIVNHESKVKKQKLDAAASEAKLPLKAADEDDELREKYRVLIKKLGQYICDPGFPIDKVEELVQQQHASVRAAHIEKYRFHDEQLVEYEKKDVLYIGSVIVKSRKKNVKGPIYLNPDALFISVKTDEDKVIKLDVLSVKPAPQAAPVRPPPFVKKSAVPSMSSTSSTSTSSASTPIGVNAMKKLDAAKQKKQK